MKSPMKTDEELTSIAEELNARGELTIENFKRAAGGGQRDRLLAIRRRVLAAAAEQAAGDAGAAAAEAGLPASVRSSLARVATEVARELAALQTTEVERARAAESAAAARHEAAIRAAADHVTLLEQDLAAAAGEAEQLRSDLERVTADLAGANEAGAELRALLQAEADRHGEERLALMQTVSQARAEATRLHAELALQSVARGKAEADAAGAGATARAAVAELERARQELATLGAQRDALLRQLSTAEAERDRALQDLRDSRELTKAPVSPRMPEASSARKPPRRRKTVQT